MDIPALSRGTTPSRNIWKNSLTISQTFWMTAFVRSFLRNATPQQRSSCLNFKDFILIILQMDSMQKKKRLKEPKSTHWIFYLPQVLYTEKNPSTSINNIVLIGSVHKAVKTIQSKHISVRAELTLFYPSAGWRRVSDGFKRKQPSICL